MDQGGWSTVSTFIEIYGHAYDEDRQRAADVMDEALGSASDD